MAKGRHGVDGGIWSSKDADYSGKIAIPKAVGPFTRMMGIDGGIASNYGGTYSGKQPLISQAVSTETALSVTSSTVANGLISQATEADLAHTQDWTLASLINSVSSSRGSGIVTANEQLTINVDTSRRITHVTVNDVDCTNVALPDGSTVTCDVPLGVSIGYGANVDVIVYKTGRLKPSDPYTAELQPPSGMEEVDFTVAYAGLDADSPFYGDTTFSSLVAGDSCIFDSLTTPDSATVDMDGTGVFTVLGSFTLDQTINYYIWDASDNTPSTTIEQITVEPGPVGETIGFASEADSSHSITPVVAVSGIIGQASESDSVFTISDGSTVNDTIDQAQEADSSQSITGKTTDIVSIAQASEVNNVYSIVDGSTVSGSIGQVSEVDLSHAVADLTSVSATISQALETSTSFEITYAASLNELRTQVTAMATKLDLIFAYVAERI